MADLRKDLNKIKNDIKKAKIESEINATILSIKKVIKRHKEKINLHLYNIQKYLSKKRAHNNYINSVKKSIKKLIIYYSKMKDDYLFDDNIEIVKKNNIIQGKVNGFYFKSSENGELNFYQTPQYQVERYDFKYYYYSKYDIFNVKLLPLNGFILKNKQTEKITIGGFFNKLSEEQTFYHGSFPYHKSIEFTLQNYRSQNKK